METLETRSNHVFTNIIDHQQRIETNLTGRLPVTPNRKNKYLFVLYEYNSNSILVRPMNNRMDKEFICVFQYLIKQLTTRGLKPNYVQFNNDSYP